MGLFDMFKKEEAKEIVEFSDVVTKTENIGMALKNVADKYNIPLSGLDFDILEVDTYIKFDKNSDFVLADEHTLSMLDNEEIWLNQDFEIKQSYEIKIRKFQFEDDFELIGTFKTNKTLVKADYIISPSSLLIYNDKLLDKIKNELKKKKLKSSMLIDIKFLEPTFEDDIEQFVAKIRVLGSVDEEYVVNLCTAIPKIEPIQMKVIEHYKKKAKNDISIKKLVYPTKEGDVIIEILKPKEGRVGRDCRGEIIQIPKLREVEIPTYPTTQDISIKEDDDKILYIAKKNGYIYKDGETFSIKDRLEVNQISLKTGSLQGGEDSDVKLEVKESGALSEAIADGMVVETTELIVKGNVGNGAKIKAKKLEIDGQTHKKSKILAIEAKINSHKGYLKAKSAFIKSLEGGFVEAKNIHITQGVSGKLIGEHIVIEKMASHLQITASKIIEITELKGSENKFIINEQIVNNKEELVEKLEDNKKDIIIKIRHSKELIAKNKTVIKNNRYTIERLKEKVKELKSKKMVVNPAYIQKIKKYNDFIKKTKKIEENLVSLKEKLNTINQELEKIQEGIFSSKIISKNGFPPYNRIEFQLTQPPIKISYDTTEKDRETKMFVLKDFGEMDYRIIGEKDDSSFEG